MVHEHGLDVLQNLQGPVALFATSNSLVLAVYFFVMKGLWPTTLGILTLGLPIIALTFAAIVFLALYDGLLSRLFSFRPLRRAGQYSYGAYVIHGVIALWLSRLIPTDRWLALFGHTLTSILGLAALKIGVAFVLAWLSWHLYESQFLKLKRYFTTTLTMVRPSATPVIPSADCNIDVVKRPW
jgi:peptidoglycan/LPS O-acetylase OafA/YrhL